LLARAEVSPPAHGPVPQNVGGCSSVSPAAAGAGQPATGSVASAGPGSGTTTVVGTAFAAILGAGPSRGIIDKIRLSKTTALTKTIATETNLAVR
jgi:hypothetical protein